MGPNPLRGRRGAVGATRRMRGERGQVVIIVAVSLFALLGLGALTVDTGSWFGDGRRVQSIADAAGMAGARVLATAGTPSAASSTALANAAQNGGSRPATCTATPSASGLAGSTNDTMTVSCTRESPSFLANLFGIRSAHIHETAKVQVFGLNKATGILPIAVEEDNATRWASQPSVTLSYRGGNEEDSSGRFAFVDLSSYGCANGRDSNGQLTAASIGSCIQNGAPNQVGPVPVDICRASPQLDENEQLKRGETQAQHEATDHYRDPLASAFQARENGQQVLLPVYDNSESGGDGDDGQHSSTNCSGSGGDEGNEGDEHSSGSTYHIVGFAVVVLTSHNTTESLESGDDEGGDDESFVSITAQFKGFVQGTTGGGCLCGANVVSIIQ